MAARLRTLKKPLAAAAATAVAGGIAYTSFSNRHSFPMPIVELQRDVSGRITPPSSLPRPKSRMEQLSELRRHGPSTTGTDDEYDLLIIGGGATGTGIAVDAVTRGLRVALVEADDFSAGTSSKSTKLVHGGVRYLEKAVTNLDYPQLKLVMEALRERRTFLNVAPHLSTELPILLPLQHWWQAPYFWAGTKAYDLLAGSRGLTSSYFMTRSRAIAAFPHLRRDSLVGALVYYDGQHNDSRMNVSLAMTAALYGATVVNHAEVTGLEKDASGKICGARVRDVLASPHEDGVDASDFSVRAKGVINATGPFTDAIERMDDPSRKSMIAPASGAHIVLPSNLYTSKYGLLDATTSDGRVVFVLPWQGYTLAGTTDNACAVEREPVARQDDIDFILKEVNKLLSPENALGRSDVLASWSGIRPLVKDPKASGTESLVRSHLVAVSDSGLLTCAGGKWTTYRQMAEDAVDEAVKTFKLEPRALAMPDISGAGLASWTTDGTCRTRSLPLVGAHGFSSALPSQLMEHYPAVDAHVAQHLAANYGDRAWVVLSSSPSPISRILPSLLFIEGEIRHGVRAEAAQTSTDLISRRTRLAFLDVNSALRALPRVIDIMAEELGWTDARKAHEWTEAVHFLRSMGLSEDKTNITRNEVLSSAFMPVSRPCETSLIPNSMEVGLGVRA